MRITLLLSDDAAGALNPFERPGPALGEDSRAAPVVDAAGRLGYRLLPVHPAARDPALRRQFYIDVPDQKAAETVTAALRPLPEVKGVYVKPAEEMPKGPGPLSGPAPM